MSTTLIVANLLGLDVILAAIGIAVAIAVRRFRTPPKTLTEQTVAGLQGMTTIMAGTDQPPPYAKFTAPRPGEDDHPW